MAADDVALHRKIVSLILCRVRRKCLGANYVEGAVLKLLDGLGSSAAPAPNAERQVGDKRRFGT
jgi:hypothetical protein